MTFVHIALRSHKWKRNCIITQHNCIVIRSSYQVLEINMKIQGYSSNLVDWCKIIQGIYTSTTYWTVLENKRVVAICSIININRKWVRSRMKRPQYCMIHQIQLVVIQLEVCILLKSLVLYVSFVTPNYTIIFFLMVSTDSFTPTLMAQINLCSLVNTRTLQAESLIFNSLQNPKKWP